jgi:15-cis-phytoene synthase
LAADGGRVVSGQPNLPANPPADPPAKRRANRLARRFSHQILAHHSKSFAFAGRLLPAWCRDDAAALYAWCRRCDDAVDGPRDTAARAAAVEQLRAELARIYGDGIESDPVLAGFQDVVRRQAIPRRYADDLVDGMAMDVGAVRYRTFDELLLYCYRAAGTVGLMMAQIMGVRDPSALRRAADLGIAMQLTNICRDVAEDAARDRVYLPADVIAADVLEACHRSGDSDGEVARAVAELLRRADDFYASADAGLPALPVRCAIGIRAARLIYAEIGRVLARRHFDVRAGRAVVSRGRKTWLALRALFGTLWTRGAGFARRRRVDLGGSPRPHPLPFPLLIEPRVSR